jgi:hypothetical protein
MDWTLGEAVIRPGYFSPFHGVQYTFGLLVFEKVATEVVSSLSPVKQER